jgi:hypothetical protein
MFPAQVFVGVVPLAIPPMINCALAVSEEGVEVLAS